jgi:predicted nucleotidyltransferase
MVNIYKLKLTCLQQEILNVLFAKVGKELNQNQIAKYLEVSPPAVMKALPQLKKEELITIIQDKETKRWSIKLNTNNPKVIQLKRVNNLKQIYISNLLNFIEEIFAGATIILFGSYAMGEDTINSDIDLAIIGRKSKHVNLEKFERTLNKNININFYDGFNKIHKHLKENILNGIVLSGAIEL